MKRLVCIGIILIQMQMSVHAGISLTHYGIEHRLKKNRTK